MNINNTASLHSSSVNNSFQQNRPSFGYRNISAQSTHENANTHDRNIDERLIEKIVATQSLTHSFSKETLDKLIDKGFLLEKTDVWRNRQYFSFINKETGKKVQADEDCITSTLDQQVLSQLQLIDEVVARVNTLSRLNNNNNPNEFSSDLKLWISRIEYTITTLKDFLNFYNIDRAIAKGFYLDKIEHFVRNIEVYTFKSRDAKYTFYIDTDNRDSLDKQLITVLAKIPIKTTSQPVSHKNINIIPEEDIDFYSYKLIIISKALVNLSNDDRLMLIGDTNDPRVNNIELFKQIMIEGINNNHGDVSRNSHLEFINNTEWKLNEINTIIRKGILFLAD